MEKYMCASITVTADRAVLDCSKMKRQPPPDREYIIGSPNEADVIMGSKRKTFTQWPGCQRFHRILSRHRQKYLEASVKQVKSQLIKEIFQVTTSNGARFLKRDANGWYKASESAIFDKVGHTMRFKPAATKRKGSTNRPYLCLREAEETVSVSSTSTSTSFREIPSSVEVAVDEELDVGAMRRSDEKGHDLAMPQVEINSPEPRDDLLSPLTVPNQLAPESLSDETRPPIPQTRKPLCVFFRPLDYKSEEEAIQLLLSETLFSS